MSKTLVMINGQDVECWSVDDLADAKYRVKRCEENGRISAGRALLVDDNDWLPVEAWLDEYYSEQAKIFSDQSDREEKQTYERLKKKFEPTSDHQQKDHTHSDTSLDPD